jgi:acetate kinase
MQTLVTKRERGDRRAALAVDAFCYQARKHVGALAAVVGGLDTLVFTGGVGENAALVRAEICRGLEHLGVELDEGQNAAHAEVISTSSSDCVVRVVSTDEDLVIARHTATLVAG